MFGFFSGKTKPNGGYTEQQLLNLQYRDILPEDYDLLLTLDNNVKRKTLTIETVEKLPTICLEADHAEKYHNGETCLVCMEALTPGLIVRQLPVCGHIFHHDCIRKWLTEQAVSCPIDKLDVAHASCH